MANAKLRGKEPVLLAEARKRVGAWLRDKRLAAGFSQKDLAEVVRFEYYTFISQIETGRGKIPSGKYVVYADALGVPHDEFAAKMLLSADPELYDMIYGKKSVGSLLNDGQSLRVVGGAVVTDESVEQRLAKLEALLNK